MKAPTFTRKVLTPTDFAASSAGFLRALVKTFPYRIHTGLTEEATAAMMLDASAPHRYGERERERKAKHNNGLLAAGQSERIDARATRRFQPRALEMQTKSRNAPTVLKTKNLVESVYEELYRRISEGELEAGEKVVIDQLARSFGISLGSIREALARLNAERMVTYERNKGYRIAQAPDATELAELSMLA